MKKTCLFIAFLLAGKISFSQTIFYSNDADVFVANEAIVQINGGAVIDNNSSFVNSSNAIVTVATNPDPGTFAFQNGSVVSGNGTYRVEQDWVNNAFFVQNNSTVELFGNSQQFITGVNSTKFHDLVLSGSGSGVNRMKSITLDASVDSSGTLTINDRELATGAFSFTVLNPTANAVSNSENSGSEGFVSSTGNGRFIRNTNASGPYSFPLGSSDGTVRYRPVVLDRLSGSNTYSTRLANVDATTESRNRSQIKQFSFCGESKLNANYFHYVNRTAGSSEADLSVYYDEAADGPFIGCSQWLTGSSQWADMDFVKEGSSIASLKSVKRSGWSDFANDAFILTNCEGLYVPNVFTPNNDGSNDVLSIKNAGIDQIHIKIYDRWGLKVFEASDPEIAWDGRSMAGVQVSDGTYYYVLKATSSTTEYPEMTGYITLVK